MNNNEYRLLKIKSQYNDEQSDLYVVSLEGELDSAGLEEFKEQIEPVVDNMTSKILVLNLDMVSYLNSNSISYLVGLSDTLKSKSIGLLIVNSNEQTDEIFSLVGFKKLVPYFNNIEDYKKSIV